MKACIQVFTCLLLLLSANHVFAQSKLLIGEIVSKKDLVELLDAGDQPPHQRPLQVRPVVRG